MSLAAGSRLGVYEVLALIGQGGMGEVYLARDTQLKREVALKVLPARLASDARGRQDRAMHVVRLWRYPVKSMQGEELTAATATELPPPPPPPAPPPPPNVPPPPEPPPPPKYPPPAPPPAPPPEDVAF